MVSEEIRRKIEPAFCFLAENALAFSRRDELLSVLHSCLMFLRLYRPSVGQMSSTRQIRERLLQSDFASESTVSVWEETSFRGDTEKVVDLLKVLSRNVIGEEGIGVCVSSRVVDRVPILEVRLDGPGAFPAELCLGAGIYLTRSAWEECWAEATCGGWCAPRSGGMDLFLAGQKEIPRRNVFPVTLFEILSQIVSALDGSEDRMFRLIQQAMELIETEKSTPAALDVIATGRRILDECFDSRGISSNYHGFHVLNDVPPLVLARTDVESIWRNLANIAAESIREDAKTLFVMGYDSKKREAAIRLDMTIFVTNLTVECYWASIERTTRRLSGSCIKSPPKENQSITITLPDTIGMELDRAFPGWDCFSEKSQQMLRMVSSLPSLETSSSMRETVFAGVLGDELGNMLLPTLAKPAVVNYAHDFTLSRSFEGLSRELSEKVLDQVRRGKVKKDIARLPSAGAVLWLFKGCRIFCSETGLNALSPEEVETLCRNLLSSRPALESCLLLLARMFQKRNMT